MTTSVNLRDLPGSLIAILPDGSEKVSFAGDWGSLKWKVRCWAADNRVGVAPTAYNSVRDGLKTAATKGAAKPVTFTINDRRGRPIVFTYTPVKSSPRKGGAKPSRKPSKPTPVKQSTKKKVVAKVSERAARRTVGTRAA